MRTKKMILTIITTALAMAAGAAAYHQYIMMTGTTIAYAAEIAPAQQIQIPHIESEIPEEIEEEMYYDSLELLALCVEAEAGNQDLYGKRMVVDVILNRVDAPDWPDDITSVITQRGQFTTWSNGAIARLWEASPESYIAVRMELDKRTRSDIYYFTAGNYGKYGTPLFKYGDHYFSGK